METMKKARKLAKAPTRTRMTLAELHLAGAASNRRRVHEKRARTSEMDIVEDDIHHDGANIRT